MEKIKMMHPDPAKKTVAMDKDKYEILKKYLLNTLKSNENLTFNELLKEVSDNLSKNKVKFDGSIQWHLAWV